ncbi:thiamine diphosphokinase [uncultured Litoreibacter sp.]|uniref:thiamine diphosphokinase n=1 Tax=uncultured Litoreibacter sp. TaxID=1392394 RepID=UPI0026144D03|nr:thiamine diphosphokinase [uncultured Litoreibacter sp.]
MAEIVHTPLFMTLLGGAPTHFRHVIQSLKVAPILVCADGGAELAVANNLKPEAVIGDMDSLSPDTRAKLDATTVYPIAEQDSTDFEKCLRSVAAPAILAHGFTGGRLDHELAACTALVRHPEQRCILMGEEDLCFLAPSSFSIDLPHGTRFSLFPMGEVTGRSEGLKYPIAGLAMAPWTRGGTSNEVTGPVRLSFNSRLMLVLLPVEHIDDVLQALVPKD